MAASVFKKTLEIPFEPSIRVRLVGQEPFYGPGVAHLMELIEQCGSVAGACDHMGLSYSKGRTMLRRLEQELGFPAVDRTQGGAGGGSARLTPRGKQLLDSYQQYEHDIKEYAQERFTRMFTAFSKQEERHETD